MWSSKRVLPILWVLACALVFGHCGGGGARDGSLCQTSEQCGVGLVCGVSGTCEADPVDGRRESDVDLDAPFEELPPQPRLCQPASKRCGDGTIEACNPSGSAWVALALCECGCESDQGRPVCRYRRCSPGVERCSGANSVRQRCGETGCGWVDTESCEFGCDSQQACRSCQPGARRCDGARALQCNAEGRWTVARVCAEACTQGGCVSCLPGARRCLETTVEVCGDDGAWFKKEVCAVGCGTQGCLSCLPGSRACAPTGHLAVCAPDGSGSLAVSCPFGCLVSTNQCNDCKPGSTRCHNGVIERCDGTAWKMAEFCPGGCNDKLATDRCLPPVNAQRLSASSTHTCAIDESDQTLWCWGTPLMWHKLGVTGSPNPLPTAPIRVGSKGDRWLSVSSGEFSSCGLKLDGSLWCWGPFLAALGGKDGVSGPQLISSERWLKASIGYEQLCALKWDRTLWCWGRAPLGVFGQTKDSSTVPVQRGAGDSLWADVEKGPLSGCAIRLESAVAKSGQLHCWGHNRTPSPIVLGALGIGVTATAYFVEPQSVLAEKSDWLQISVGDHGGCGIQGDGSLWCFGAVETFGVPASLAPGGLPSQIHAGPWAEVRVGREHLCLRRDDGRLFCSGTIPLNHDAGWLQPVPDPTGSSWAALTAGWRHSCGRRIGGQVWCWGKDADYKLTFTDFLPWSATAIPKSATNLLGAGFLGATAPTRYGWPVTWLTTSSRPGCGISASGALHCHAGLSAPLSSSLPPVVDVAAKWSSMIHASDSYCALTEAGALWCWGNNVNGRLGDGSTVPRNQPTLIDGGLPVAWKQVDLGYFFGCGIKVDGSLHCWGRVDNGGWAIVSNLPKQLPTPTAMPFAGPWRQISVGQIHLCGIKQADDSLWCWGGNSHRQLGIGSDANYAVLPMRVGSAAWSAVAAGEFHTCGIKKDDASLWCWGGGQFFGTPKLISEGSWLEISGGVVSYAIDSDHKLWRMTPHNSAGPQLKLVASSVPIQWRSVSPTKVSNGDGVCGVDLQGALYCWGPQWPLPPPIEAYKLDTTAQPLLFVRALIGD